MARAALATSDSAARPDCQSLSLCLHALAVLNVGDEGDEGDEGEGAKIVEAVVERIVVSDWRSHSSCGSWPALSLLALGCAHESTHCRAPYANYAHASELTRWRLQSGLGAQGQ